MQGKNVGLYKAKHNLHCIFQWFNAVNVSFFLVTGADTIPGYQISSSHVLVQRSLFIPDKFVLTFIYVLLVKSVKELKDMVDSVNLWPKARLCKAVAKCHESCGFMHMTASTVIGGR